MTNRDKAYFIIQHMRLEGYLKGEMIDRVAEALQRLDQLPSPWELLLVHLYRGTGRGTIETAMDVVDARLAEGWEPWQVGGADKAFLIMRRRKAVSDEQKTLNANSN